MPSCISPIQIMTNKIVREKDVVIYK